LQVQNGEEKLVNSTNCFAGLAATVLLLAGCASPPAPGSKDEAVNKAWEAFCKAGYCEGYPSTILARTEKTLTVSINGNTRYLTYNVSGEPGKYVASVSPTADRGRTKP